MLRLDPIGDRDEYAALVDALERADALSAGTVRETVDRLLRAPEPLRSLGARARNLGVDRWQIWSGDDAGSLEDLVQPGGPRCVVADLGSLATREEQAVAAEALLAALWRRRAAREPVLIVIDEAHNVCPARPEDPLMAMATEHAVRIAGEGRKFGLVLLVATQRPQKVHENVVSQCDNLVLMRMNSRSDLALLARDVLVRAAAAFSRSRRSSGRARRWWRASSSRPRRSGASGRAGRPRAAPTCLRTGPPAATDGNRRLPAPRAEPLDEQAVRQRELPSRARPQWVTSNFRPTRTTPRLRFGSHDQQRGRPAQSLHAGEDDALHGEHAEPETERDPDSGLRRDRAEGAQQQRGERWHSRLHDRPLASCDPSQMRDRQVLVVGNAVGEPVRVNVSEPEDDRGDDDHSGDLRGVVRKGLRPGDEHG